MHKLDVARHPGGADLVFHLDDEPNREAVRGHLTETANGWSVELSAGGGGPLDPLSLAVAAPAALAEVRKLGGGEVHLWLQSPTSDHDRIAEDNGLAPGREQCRMRRPLPLPDGVTSRVATRSFRVGEDEGGWLDLNNRAFAGHPEQGAWVLATLRAREVEPWFDPDGFRLYEDGGKLAGYCWTKVHAPSSTAAGTAAGEVGEIYVIAIDPELHGRGLGRDLTVAGLEWLTSRGIGDAMLYVDRSNRAAVALYADLGFRVDRLDRAYVTRLDPEA